MKRIPKKLKEDAIVEALLEIRFETSTIPEIFYGRLADYDPWKNFKQNRLPAYEIPAPVRLADAGLRYQPVFELRNSEQNRQVRIGPNVISYHRLVPYVGWDTFKRELVEAIDGIFSKSEDLTVRRIGLRYINAIRPELHHIESIVNLDMGISVENENITSNVNLNFTSTLADDTECTVRVATTEFVQGNVPPNTSIFVDVDVFTKEGFRTKDRQQVVQWIEFAHIKEKEHFFRLLTQDSIDALEEK